MWTPGQVLSTKGYSKHSKKVIFVGGKNKNTGN